MRYDSAPKPLFKTKSSTTLGFGTYHDVPSVTFDGISVSGYTPQIRTPLSASHIVRQYVFKEAISLVPCTLMTPKETYDMAAIVGWPQDPEDAPLAYDTDDRPSIRGHFYITACDEDGLLLGVGDILDRRDPCNRYHKAIVGNMRAVTSLTSKGWRSFDVLTGLDVHWDSFCEVE